MDADTLLDQHDAQRVMSRLASVLVHDCDSHAERCWCFGEADVRAYERARAERDRLRALVRAVPLPADLYITTKCLAWTRTLTEARGFTNRGGMMLPAAPATREALVRCSCGRHKAFEGCVVRYTDDGLQSLFAGRVV